MTSVKRPSFLEYNIKLMKTICMWPLDSKSYTVKLLNSVYAITMAISLALASVGQIVEIFVSPDLSAMASAVDLATLTASGLFKMSYIIIYNNHFQDLVAKIDANFLESDSPQSTFHISKWVKNSKLYSTVYSFSAGFTLLVFFVVLPILAKYIPFLSSRPFEDTQPSSLVDSDKMFSLSYNLSKSVTSLSVVNVTQAVKNEKFFPMKCWFPFDVTWSPLYEIVFLWEIYPLIGSGHLYLVSDSFFFMIIYLACGQMEILKLLIRSLNEKYTALTSENKISIKNSSMNTNGRISPIVWDLYAREKEIERTMNKEISKCVDFHVQIIEVIRQLEMLLRSMILADFLHAVISLSFALLQTATANALYEWVQMFVFIAICILHQFLNNYFSDILMQQQASVAEVVYELPWENSSDIFNAVVAMTTHQSRHVTQLSGCKMYWLGLPTFVEFMKTLVSYFLVLQSLQADEVKERIHNKGHL